MIFVSAHDILQQTTLSDVLLPENRIPIAHNLVFPLPLDFVFRTVYSLDVFLEVRNYDERANSLHG